MRRPLRVLRGLPGHPSHPPLTGATVGAFVTASGLGLASAAAVAPERTAVGWWLALVVGLILTLPTMATGMLDWIVLDHDTPPRQRATRHFVVTGCAAVLFALAAVLGHAGYQRAVVDETALALTLIGLATLTYGGWLGGGLVFEHGVRVESRDAVEPIERSPD
jgi:uncharacterized membrane protein